MHHQLHQKLPLLQQLMNELIDFVELVELMREELKMKVEENIFLFLEED